MLLISSFFVADFSGSGFKSKRAYRNGYFGVSMKVQPGYTAGVNTAFYVSTSPPATTVFSSWTDLDS